MINSFATQSSRPLDPNTMNNNFDQDEDEDEIIDHGDMGVQSRSNPTSPCYPAWCLSFFAFALFQAVFAMIPMGVVSYFMSLISGKQSIPPPYVLIMVSSLLSTLIILCCSLIILHQFRNSRATVDITLEIDSKSTGKKWPGVFVLSQIIMSIFWIGIFIYIMLLTGGISTACSIPNSENMCRGIYADTCRNYVAACRLVNLIVVSCALEVCFWISGTISMFVSAAVTYRRRAISDMHGVSMVLKETVFGRNVLDSTEPEKWKSWISKPYRYFRKQSRSQPLLNHDNGSRNLDNDDQLLDDLELDIHNINFVREYGRARASFSRSNLDLMSSNSILSYIHRHHLSIPAGSDRVGENIELESVGDNVLAEGSNSSQRIAMTYLPRQVRSLR
ncbi:hypothetical protein V1514DRAFT_328277 [Lipomyces japonicus]|uniref:uncharacterized protein n=1 Tax=Lipomyces japonicus TaxID=56871 RepID=UPI0034CF49DE